MRSASGEFDEEGVSRRRYDAGSVIQQVADGVVLSVRVVTRASRPGPAGVRAGALVVRLQSAPVDNAANDELLERLAALLGVPRRVASIASGGRSRSKRVFIAGMDAATAMQRLGICEGGSDETPNTSGGSER
jgi:uncharacterized protein YggU (UPF0235/DUF167 family)